MARIVQAAADLFARHGYNGVSINAIAAAADTSKANVFHHFRNKDELYLAVLQHVAKPSQDALRELTGVDRDAGERLSEFARAHARILEQHSDTARLVMREILDPGRGEKNAALASQVFAENFSMLVSIIREGQEAGTLRAGMDAGALATVLVGMNVFFAISRDGLAHYPEVDFADNPELFVERLLDILSEGIHSKGPSS